MMLLLILLVAQWFVIKEASISFLLMCLLPFPSRDVHMYQPLKLNCHQQSLKFDLVMLTLTQQQQFLCFHVVGARRQKLKFHFVDHP